MKPLLLFVTIALLAGCAGVFTNPDIQGDSAVLSQGRIRDMAESPAMELQILSQLRDTGFASIPESDFFLLQDYFLNALTRFHNPALPFAYFSDAKSGLSASTDLDHPRFPAVMFLSQLPAQGFCVYDVKDCPPPLVRAMVVNRLPLLFFGTLHYKRATAVNRETIDPDQERGLSIALDGTGRRILRRLEMFDLVYGYARLQGETRRLPGEEGPEYVYETRSNLNFRAFDSKPLLNHALPLYGKPGPGNTRNISGFFLVLPDTANVPALTDRIAETAARFGLRGEWQRPVKIY